MRMKKLIFIILTLVISLSNLLIFSSCEQNSYYGTYSVYDDDVSAAYGESVVIDKEIITMENKKYNYTLENNIIKIDNSSLYPGSSFKAYLLDNHNIIAFSKSDPKDVKVNRNGAFDGYIYDGILQKGYKFYKNGTFNYYNRSIIVNSGNYKMINGLLTFECKKTNIHQLLTLYVDKNEDVYSMIYIKDASKYK